MLVLIGTNLIMKEKPSNSFPADSTPGFETQNNVKSVLKS